MWKTELQIIAQCCNYFTNVVENLFPISSTMTNPFFRALPPAMEVIKQFCRSCRDNNYDHDDAFALERCGTDLNINDLRNQVNGMIIMNKWWNSSVSFCNFRLRTLVPICPFRYNQREVLRFWGVRSLLGRRILLHEPTKRIKCSNLRASTYQLNQIECQISFASFWRNYLNSFIYWTWFFNTKSVFQFTLSFLRCLLNTLAELNLCNINFTLKANLLRINKNFRERWHRWPQSVCSLQATIRPHHKSDVPGLPKRHSRILLDRFHNAANNNDRKTSERVRWNWEDRE